jgi:pimeloyl-ACP methyl ester carboxylesterase
MPKHKNHGVWIFPFAMLLASLACNFPAFTALQATSPPGTAPSPASSITQLPTFGETPDSTPFQPASPAPSATPPVPTATAAYQPTFESAECAFSVPAGYNAECGYLIVPENRARPGSTLIKLHVAVFRSRSEDPANDPVVHLAGGPGSSSLSVAGYILGQGMDAILERRDLILFDQRGTGYSQPRLDCPEREALTPTLLEGNLSSQNEADAIVEALRDCHERLSSEGVDLSAYNSAASAADINDLREVLGYAQLNLYGVSYGTRLGLTLMRDHPEAVRGAVLDSAYPPQVNLYTSLAPNAERAFNQLFAGCAADPACRSSYPELRAEFYNLVDALNANPGEVSLTANGVAHSIQVDGDLLIDVLFVGLYTPQVTAWMPRMIFDLQQGETGILQERLRLYFDQPPALGMQMAVQCNEEIPFSLVEESFVLAEGVEPQIAAFFPKSVQPLFAACEEWRSEPLEAIENQPVVSDVPALILAGEYDPITPPKWGRMTAETLSNAYFYEYPGNGHWVTRSSSCARQMAFQFWEQPAEAPDSGCMQEGGGIMFVGE